MDHTEPIWFIRMPIVKGLDSAKASSREDGSATKLSEQNSLVRPYVLQNPQNDYLLDIVWYN